MNNINDLKTYKKHFSHSYAFGAFAVHELLSARPGNALAVYIRSDFTDADKLEAVCAKEKVAVTRDDRAFSRVGQKENNYTFAAFTKYECALDGNKPHVCLVNPGDMGNLGSILRSMAAFGFLNLSIITPAADIFDPKTVRASMGALFRVNFKLYPSFEEYKSEFPRRMFFPFMTDGAAELEPDGINTAEPFTLVFGGEAAGLPPSFADIGQAIKIPQTSLVDSLNLSVSVGIGLFAFRKR